MSEKQELIKEMLDLQKRFIAYEHKQGVTQQEYFGAGEGHELHNYRQRYNDLAMKLVDVAHAEKGSHA